MAVTSTSAAPQPPSEKDIAHKLLVELLVHQFAFPVQWIDTQDSLFSGSQAIQRCIELGPSKVLTGMAKKTMVNRISAGINTPDTEITFLASSQDSGEACYEYPAPNEAGDETKDGAKESTEGGSTSVLPPAPINVVAPVVQQAAVVETAKVEDAPLGGEEVLRAFIARKLKKSVSSISPGQSIRDLCGGKSTLQNEIIGNFHDEFQSMPDTPEDMPLKDLAAAVTNGSGLELGKVSKKWIAAMVASKMPARFGAGSIRRFVAEEWGFGPGRQDSLLTFLLANEPASRLPSENAAKDYLKQTVEEMAKTYGIKLQVQIRTSGTPQNTLPAADPAVVAELSQQQSKLAMGQFKALGQYLNVDLLNSSSEVEARASALQEKLDLVTSEFSDDFFAGITPVFSTKTCRKYSSWWNNARQEVLRFYTDPAFRNMLNTEAGVDKFLHRIGNCADESLCSFVEKAVLRFGLNGPYATSISQRLAKLVSNARLKPPSSIFRWSHTGPQTEIAQDGLILYHESPRGPPTEDLSYIDLLSSASLRERPRVAPFVSLRGYSAEVGKELDLTDALFDTLATLVQDGLSVVDQTILITGGGQGSIGTEIVRILLEGGARVIVTTSREPSSVAKYWQQLYDGAGSKGAELTLLRFNQTSVTDCKALIDFIYDAKGLNTDLDAIVPFAAASEAGVEMTEIDTKNELAHRLMLTNLYRLLGQIVQRKRDRSIDCHPTQVLLPLSPNHGTFGSDGLYAESKLGLESLLNRVSSESWSNELSICGVNIGWTRSTGLMSANDTIAEIVEQHGVLTFSTQEMAFNIATLLTPTILDLCANGPLLADFSGGLSSLPDCSAVLSTAREELAQTAEIARAVAREDQMQDDAGSVVPPTRRKARLQVGFPQLPCYERDLSDLYQLQGVNSPADSIVVVGFAELGPLGSARLRWEIESTGKLSKEGYVEAAWMMNLIKHFDGPHKDGHYVGWVDVKTGNPVHDADMEHRYGDYIAAHTGIRPVESEAAGYDPERKEYLQEIVLDEDLPAFEATLATAESFKLRHGSYAAIEDIGNDTYRVHIKRGASVRVPKSVPFAHGAVAGQLPTGWNPSTYGIPEDIINQVDPTTLYALCCVSEALLSAGICDPWEIFEHIHLSELGNFIGSSMGGATKTRGLYKDVHLEKDVHSDALQDTYLNTTAAWINMLLLGSAGPIKTPVGACATGVESIDSGVDSIRSGKIKMCIVGGCDDLLEDSSYGFAQMKATVNAEEELAKGRLPFEMSRPTAESRAGFVESHGCGVQILCRGDVALEMGLPVYGIIGGSTMAADRIGRSVPEPGQGVLSFASESVAQYGSPRSFRSRSSSCDSDAARSISESSIDLATSTGLTTPNSADWAHHKSMQSPLVPSPLRVALQKWTLTVDDLGFASLHGTSTQANDLNEPDIICKQLAHLGHDAGRPLWAVCQKSITGHPKAPAAAWMLNGSLQVLNQRLIPANRNADNVDPRLKPMEHLCFATQRVQTEDIKAFLLTSFGFGQKGGQLVGIAPKYFFATLSAKDYEDYCNAVTKRRRYADRAFAKAIMTNQVVVVKKASPYRDDERDRILLDPRSRTSRETSTGLYKFNVADLPTTKAEGNKPAIHDFNASTECTPARAAQSSREWMMSDGSTGSRSVGVDMVRVDSFSGHLDDIFVGRNYTSSERAYALKSRNQQEAFASRWCAKEAVFKCLGTVSKGPGAPLREIEISGGNGAPQVRLYDDALAAAQNAGLNEFRVSISHEDGYIVAVAIGMHADDSGLLP